MTDPADHDYGSWPERKIATVTTPCHACGRPVDLHGQHSVMHPFGRSKPQWVLCSEACCVDLSQAMLREQERIAHV